MIREKRIEVDVQSKFGLLPAVFKAYPEVVAALLFGSYGEGTVNPLSDVDIAYLSNTKLDLYRESDLHYEITRTLSTDEVDLVALDRVPLSSRFKIVTGGKVLYCKDEIKLADFRESTTKEYLDFKPYLDEYHRCFTRNLVEGELFKR